jgi:hypothetical protein
MSEDDTPGRADEAFCVHELEAHAAIFPRNNDGRVADRHIICVALGRARNRYGIFGLLGGVITCGVLYATALIMHRYDL